MVALQAHSSWQADACGLVCSCNALHNQATQFTCYPPALPVHPHPSSCALPAPHLQVLIPAEPWHSLLMGGEELYAEEEGQVTVQ